MYSTFDLDTGVAIQPDVDGWDCQGDFLGSLSGARIIKDFNVAGRLGASGGSTFVSASDQILFVSAGEINAAITCTGGSGPFIQRIETTGANSTTGDFTGSLSTNYLTCDNCAAPKGMKVKRDLTASLSFSNLITNAIDIDRSLTGSITATSGANSGGLITVNSANGGGSWSGTVTLNSHVLSTGQSQPNLAPHYDRSSSSLGGGDVGLVPFQCHLADCSPAHVATVTSWTPASSTVTLRHYGNVTWSGMPVIISRCVLNSECDPDFDIITTQWVVNNSPGTRDLVLKLDTGQTLTADRHYHIRPVQADTNMLKCSGIAGVGNVPVGDYNYEFIYDP